MKKTKQGLFPVVDDLNPKKLNATIAFPDDEIHAERRTFDIHTYFNLKSKSSSWSTIEPANEFISTLDGDEYSYLVKLFIRAKRDLNMVNDRETLMNAITAIDEKVAKTFGKLSLADRLYDYVCKDKRIVIPDRSGIVARPQDTKEMTFHEDDYRLINTIVIIAKILFPIFGEIIKKIQFVKDTNSGVKEIVAFGIVNSLMNRDFDLITRKLHNYIGNIVSRSLANDDQMNPFYGITETSLTYDKLAKMIIKNFVNFDLYKDDSNVMRYLSVTVKRAIDTETSGSKQLSYQARFLPTDGTDDGRNVSLLENSVTVSNDPVDIAPIIKFGIEQVITDYVKSNSIRSSLFNQSVRYYQTTTIPPTVVNELVVAMFIAEYSESAYCVKYMTMDMMVKMITIIQIYAMRMGFASIVPLLSMIPTNITKTDPDDADNHIVAGYGRGDGQVNYYVNLKELMSHIEDFPNFNVEELLKELAVFVAGTVHMFNVAPAILELGVTGNTRSVDDIVKYDEKVVFDLYRFIHHLLTTTDRRIV